MALVQTPPEPVLRDPRRRSREFASLLWLCGWGGIAAVALVALAITSQTETASERLRHIFASNESAAIARMPPKVAQLESETQILAAQVRALSTDRDRLAGRIALLESTIDDMTGTIKKLAVATAAALAARAAPPAPSAPATDPPASNTAIVATRVPTVSFVPAPRADTPITPTIAPPQARVAAATEPEPQVPNQNEFGLDLGGGGTVDAVRQRWTMVKANFGPLLSGMRPLAAPATTVPAQRGGNQTLDADVVRLGRKALIIQFVKH